MVTMTRPRAQLHERFSAPGAEATPWSEARQVLHDAEIYWLSTVHPSGRPHVTPLIGIWLDGAAHFCTGADERKARNLDENPCCTLTTGTNRLADGLDVVVEGIAERLHDDELLRSIARCYLDKYGSAWAFEVRDGAFSHPDGGLAVVYELAPVTAFAFRRGHYSQTRYRF